MNFSGVNKFCKTHVKMLENSSRVTLSGEHKKIKRR